MPDTRPKTELSKLSIAPDKRDARFADDSIPLRKLFLPTFAFIILGLAIAIGSFFSSSGRARGGEGQVTSVQGLAPQPINSLTFTTPAFTADGYVVAERKASVSSNATGRLKDLRVAEGDEVKAGDVLAVLENDDLAATVREREANVAALQAGISSAEADLNDALLQNNRVKELKEERVVSQAELAPSETRLKRSQAELTGARAALALAEAQLERSRVDLSYTYIVAPFSGTVLSKNADVGEIVAPFGSSADARATVVTIADMTSLEVQADVSEADIAKVQIGQEVEITLDSVQGQTYHGSVKKIVPTVDRAKSTVLTKIQFTDLNAHVLPEMSAKITFKLDTGRTQKDAE